MKDDGGPAFPADPKIFVNEGDGTIRGLNYSGMSLRDYFAGQALPAILDRVRRLAPLSKDIDQPTFIAGLAYETADAMIAERAKK